MEQGTQPETVKRWELKDAVEVMDAHERQWGVLDECEVVVLASDYDTLRAECERLRAENDDFKRGWLAERNQRDRDRARADKAEASVQALRKALEELIRTNAGPTNTPYGTFVFVELSAFKACEALLAGGEAATQETPK